MNRLLVIVFLFVGGLWPLLPAGAQSAPDRGMVWAMPEERTQAVAELREMHEIGVEAVRTGVIRDTTLLTLADTLGLQLYQELPIDYYPAAQLRDTLDHARTILTQALRRAQGHPSARHFGLARRSETSDTGACAYFEQLAEQVEQEGPPGSTSYYVSAFVTNDRCVEAVDLVLVDALRISDPLQRLVRWRQANADTLSPAPVGLATLGTPVLGDAGTGLRRPYSPESQARYFENALRSLLADTAEVAAPVFFVYRWRDVSAEQAATAYGFRGPTPYSYGLIGPEGERRPAYDVVRGFFTGRQTVFAFEQGASPPASLPWLTLLGWSILLLLALGYAFSEQFQQLLPRYFLSHGFYREALEEGRHSLVGVGVVLLVALSLCMGLIGSGTLQLVKDRELTILLLQELPEGSQEFAISMLNQPIMTAFLLASLYAFCMGLWTLLLSALSRFYKIVSPMQALMLILWPQWWLVPLMVGLLVLDSLPPGTALWGLSVLWSVLLAVCLYATLRTVYDYTKVAQVSYSTAVVVGAVSPAFILLIVVVFSALGSMEETSFIWSLASREVML